MDKFVASPYTWTVLNKPKTWGIWNTELEIWTPNLFSRKRDAENTAKDLNALGR